ncbi:HU family DNA-binding protein [bacterium]|nr:HU family DNA-binding protein [bacterium]MDC0338811.1 HU family DNA-binding protein [Flavobacteriales bacterium]
MVINKAFYLSTKPIFLLPKPLPRLGLRIYLLGQELIINHLKFKKMNKQELVDAIAGDSGLSKADAKRAVDGFVSVVGAALKKDDRVALVGFGSFSISKRAARTGRNPQTGAAIQIKAKNVVKFKAGADLSGKVN